jgi:hypothetical protein
VATGGPGALLLIPDLALAAAFAWGAGIRLYATLFMLGCAARFGWIELPAHLAILSTTVVLGASGFMTLVEFFADKVPWVDSLWDVVHTFIRIPAGALLAAAVFGDSGAAVALAAAILGGAVSAGSHFSKSGTRAGLNASPEPFSNWLASFAEDAAIPAGLWLAYVHPVLFLVLLALLFAAALLLLRWIASQLAALVRRLQAR